MTTVLEQIHAAFARRGHEGYGEGVSQLDHALQCGMFAQRDGAPLALVAAAFLHDIGHLLHDLPQDIADTGLDTQHESTGSAWLSQYFGPEVTEPVRMHVAAKRYLCGKEADYFAKLSKDSVLSLSLQGGPMSAAEIAEFERQPHWQEAVRLRRYDEGAKVKALQTPPLSHFMPYVAQVLRAEG
jgi:phosphonate degradation associated HDIG domain protein